MPKGVLDPALSYLLKMLREENKSLPPDKQMGLRAYCKKYGILAPEQLANIERHEIPFSDLVDSGADATGEEHYEED